MAGSRERETVPMGERNGRPGGFREERESVGENDPNVDLCLQRRKQKKKKKNKKPCPH
jgi:hypothetical protein